MSFRLIYFRLLMLMHTQAKTELSLAVNEFILFSKKIFFEIYSLLPFITLSYPIIMDNQKNTYRFSCILGEWNYDVAIRWWRHALHSMTNRLQDSLSYAALSINVDSKSFLFPNTEDLLLEVSLRAIYLFINYFILIPIDRL